MAQSLQPPIPESHSPAEARRPTGSLYMLALLLAAAVLNATDRGTFAIAMPTIKHTYSFTGGSWRPLPVIRHGPLLLILDEAQVLASPAHADLAHSLRAGLDIHKQTIKVIFAGSSESSLRQMFGRAAEPFYNWAPIEPFERLGAEFVTAMTHKVNQLSRYSLSEREALRAFEALKRTPEFFRRWVCRPAQVDPLLPVVTVRYRAA